MNNIALDNKATPLDFETLQKKAETSYLDWKVKLPDGILGKNGEKRDTGKGKLLKDIVAIANSINDEFGYLVYGVRDHRTKRQVIGIKEASKISSILDDANIQTWVENHIDPPINFHSFQLEPEPQKIVLCIEIRPWDYPHVIKKELGGIIYEGQVIFRRNSKNTIALADDLERYFSKPEPFKIARLDHKYLVELKEYYKEKGYETSAPNFGRKDEKTKEGYKIAYEPGTRREIWIGCNGNNCEHILMLKPLSK